MSADAMPKKYILLASAVAALGTGCASLPRDTELPQARPLGAEYKTIARTPDAASTAVSGANLETTDAITLEQALALALMRSPELEAFSHAVLAAQALAFQSTLWPNPKVEVGVSEFDRGGESFDAAEIEVVLGQRLELEGKRGWRARVAEAEGELAGWDYESKRLDVFTETAQRFTEVIAAQRRLELAKSAAALAEQTSEAVRERVKADKEPPVQATKAAAELEMARLAALEAENSLAISRRKLAATWVSEQPHFQKVVGDFDDVIEGLPSLEILRVRLSSNPDAAHGNAELRLRQAALASERAARVPDLDASIGLQRFEEDGTDALAFGIGFPLPLFDRNQGNIAAAKHELARAEAARRAAESALAAELANAHGTLRSAHGRAQTLRSKVVPAMEEAFAAAREGYRKGKFGFLDMPDAQRGLFEARGALVDALSAYHAAVTTIQRLTATSIEELLKSKAEDIE